MVGGLLVARASCASDRPFSGTAVASRRACFAAALAASAADAFGAGQAFHDVAVAFAFAGAITMVLDAARPAADDVLVGCRDGRLRRRRAGRHHRRGAARDPGGDRGRGDARPRPLAGHARARPARSPGSPRWASCRCSRRRLRRRAADPRARAPGPRASSARSCSPRSWRTPRTALTLLVVGQFVSLPPVAATLATVTVLTGMARAGLTIVERLRATERDAVTDDLTGPRQPPPSAQPAGRGAQGQGRRRRAAADRPRRLQGAQRHARALGRRRGAAPDRPAPAGGAAAGQHARAARRGRVRGRSGPRRRGQRLGDRRCGCARRSSAPSASAASACTSTPASASRSSPTTATTRSALLQRADVAMYEAKRTRTGHEVYLPERDHHSRRRLELLGELRDGLAGGELVLHYQPKAEIATRRGARRRGARALGAPAPRPADAVGLPAARRPLRPRPLADRVRARSRAGGDRRSPARRVRPLGRGQPRPRRPARPRPAVATSTARSRSAASRRPACAWRSPRTS